MKISKKVFSFIMALAMILSALVPMAALAVEPTGNLIIHKYYFADKLPAELPEGTGEAGQQVPNGAYPLKGAEFSIWAVDEDADTRPTGNPLSVVVTNEDGSAVFNNLPLGRYYVEETKLPKGITQGSEPFFIDIPTTSNDGSRLIYDVHVYPKNEMILGAARLVKQDEDANKLAGGEFDLYKLEGGVATKINGRPLVTNGQGEILVGDLEVGDYYFVETKAPEGYGLNEKYQKFAINKHAYLDGQLVDENVVQITMTNYLKPEEPEKDVSNKNPGIGDKVTWTIKTNLPGDIKDYSVYKITDNLHEALNYAGNVKVTLRGSTLPQTAYSLTEPTGTGSGQLVINFNPAQLSAGELVITFDTVINEKAVVGEPIENEAQLDYNNGYEEGSEKSPKTDVTVGGKKFKKVDGKTTEALKGAEFIVFKEIDGTKLYLKMDANGMISWSLNKNVAYRFTSNVDGLIDIKGLAYGTYFIEEVKAPLGEDGKPYNLLQKPVKFVVDDDSYNEKGMAKIENNKRPKMPQTGGIGTALFTILGLGLMGVAVKSYKKED